MVPVSPGQTLPFCEPVGLQLSLCPPPLQKRTLSACGFWGQILRDAQSSFLQLALQEIQPGLPAAFFHSSLHFTSLCCWN